MRPLDPRLLRHARRTSAYIGVLIALGAVAAALVIAQAQLLAGAITAAFQHGAGLATLRAAILLLGAVVAGRVLIAWATEAAAYRASASVKSTLRRQLLAHATALGPRWLAGRRTGELAALASEGIDALDGYFAAYLPQLVLAVVVPVAVLARVASADLLAGATIALTLPLIPVFGALVGRAAGAHARRRWLALARLSNHFLDVVAGLPTLKVFGRARAQQDSIRGVSDEYRRTTMGTLRLAFLSSLVLELVATISVALVAVGIGLRLLDGHLGLRTGLLALILAPEAYLPLRRTAAQFHASADGLAAADSVFRVLEEPQAGSAVPAPDAAAGAPAPATHDRWPSAWVLTHATGHRSWAGGVAGPPGPAGSLAIRVLGVAVDHPDRAGAAPDGASLTVSAGAITVAAGPSGCGKSTLIAVLLGFAAPTAGRVLVSGLTAAPDGAAVVDLTGTDPGALRPLAGWVPQDPVLFPGTVESNIRLGRPDAPAGAVAAAARAAALTEIPLDKRIGERGSGLSSGQRRRVALARALLPGRPVLLLDEPTAGLDAAAEARVLTTLRAEASAGRAILIASHRPAVIAAADHVAGLAHPAARPADGTRYKARPPGGPPPAGDFAGLSRRADR